MKIEPNNIYCGDCYELIKQMEDKSVDLIITDPPYEFVYVKKGSNRWSGLEKNQEIVGLGI